MLKGPQGTFFGRNATGGAIRFITNKPSDEFEGDIDVSLGNYGYTNVTGVFNTPLSDTVAVRLVGQKSDRDGFADNLFTGPGVPDEVDDLDTLSLRGKLKWDISDNANLLLSADYYKKQDYSGQDIRIVSPPGFAVPLNPPFNGVSGTKRDEVALNFVPEADIEEIATTADLSISFDSFDLVSSTAYTDADTISGLDADASTAAIVAVQTDNYWDIFSQEFRIQSNYDSSLQWLAGVYYYMEDSTYETIVNAAASLGELNVETESAAIFGQAEWSFTPDLTLILGARWTTEEKDVSLASSTFPGVVVTLTGPTPYSDSEKWDEFTPRATLQYKFGEQMAYFTYSKGFKSGGFSYPLLSAGQPLNVLDPEYLDMYEIGAKGSLADGRLRYDASVYYYDYTDLQVSRTTDGTTIVTENAADAEVYGLDLYVEFLATDNWYLSAGLNMLDHEYKDYSAAGKTYGGTPGVGNIAINADGEPLLGASDYSYTLSSRYVIPVGDATVPVVLTYSYKDSYIFDFIVDPLLSGFEQDGYGILNSRISYEPNSGQWSVGIWGKNLTDEEYLAATGAGNFGHNALEGDPRTYGIDMSFNF